jgi:hypothetical protein
MEQVEVSNGLIKKIHQMVYDELKTKYKINKFVKECKYLNGAISLGDLNRQINELIENYYMCKDIKFNRDINDFFLSEIEYIIFYYFRENDFDYSLINL